MSAILSIAILIIATTSEAALPSTITACSRNLRPPEPCILEAVELVRSRLATGDLGDGFRTPALEPLALEAIRMSRGSEFQARFNDLLVNGPSNFVVQNLRADVPKLAFDFDVLLPRLNFTGKYTLKIKLLLLDLQGEGEVTGQFKNTRANVRIQGKTVNRPNAAGNGTADFVTFERLETKIHISKGKFHLENLFGGDKTLSQVGNQFVNENSELFLAELTPGMENSLSRTFLEIVNVIMKNVTYDEMFPDT